MIFVLILLGLFIFGLVLGHRKQWSDGPWVGVATPAALLMVVSIGLFCSYYPGSLGDYGTLRAYSQTSAVYDSAIDRTAKVVVRLDRGAMVNIAPSVENSEHSTQTAQRIKEARDYRREMSELYYRYKTLNEHWFTRQWIARMPDDIEM